MVKNDQKSVHIICELSLKREIEFTIEVVSGTTSIIQTPYCMTPSEFKELKDQLGSPCLVCEEGKVDQ